MIAKYLQVEELLSDSIEEYEQQDAFNPKSASYLAMEKLLCDHDNKEKQQQQDVFKPKPSKYLQHVLDLLEDWRY